MLLPILVLLPSISPAPYSQDRRWTIQTQEEFWDFVDQHTVDTTTPRNSRRTTVDFPTLAPGDESWGVTVEKPDMSGKNCSERWFSAVLTACYGVCQAADDVFLTDEDCKEENLINEKIQEICCPERMKKS